MSELSEMINDNADTFKIQKVETPNESTIQMVKEANIHKDLNLLEEKHLNEKENYQTFKMVINRDDEKKIEKDFKDTEKLKNELIVEI